MMKRFLGFLLFASLLFTSCTKLGEVELKEIKVKSFQLRNTSTADIDVEFSVHNPTNRDLFLCDAKGVLKRGGVDFATITLIQCDTVVANRISVNNMTFRMDLVDPLSLLSMGLNLSQWKFSDFNIDLRAVIRPSNGRRRVLKMKDMPLEKLARRL